MLLGLVRDGEGVAVQVLVSLGADLSGVRQQVIGVLSGFRQGGEGVEETATTGGPGGSVRHGPSGPRCPSCRALLEGQVAYRILTVEPADPNPEVGPLQVAFVYCRRCGGTIAHTLTDTDERPRFSPSGDVSTGFVGSFVREDQASFTLVPVRRERAALAREFPDELWNAVAPV